MNNRVCQFYGYINFHLIKLRCCDKREVSVQLQIIPEDTGAGRDCGGREGGLSEDGGKLNGNRKRGRKRRARKKRNKLKNSIRKKIFKI